MHVTPSTGAGREQAPRSIAALVAYRAREQPGAVFCRFQDEVIDYAELALRTRRAAARLRELGVTAGDRVALMLPGHPDHIAMFLGLAWLGAVLVPVSVHAKTAGLELQLRDAAPSLVIAEGAHAAELAPAVDTLRAEGRLLPVAWRGIAPRTGALDHVLGSWREQLPVSEAAHAASPERMVCISYTSGTTGAPKGVMLSEHWFEVGAKNAELLADVQADDVLFLWEPFHHIAGWMTVLMSLRRGVSIGMVERFSASRCWDQVRHFGATKLHYLGGVMNLLLRQPPREDDADNPVTIAWGAAAPTASWREFERRFDVRVREGYGLTEGANFNTLNLEGRVGSIGRPIDEYEAWIAGTHGAVLGPREVGEIVLRPKLPGVTMLGYYGQPQKTAEVLRDGCVHTGDLGYQDEDGFFYYAGRSKDSLRRRGENVSAWEVERILNAHPAVEDSAVIGVPSAMGEEDIKAFVKSAPGTVVEAVELLRWCEQRLAYYQVPRYFAFVAELPRGPTQRVQKASLSRAVDDCEDMEPRAARSAGP